jgi:hypothetical protein
VRLVELRAQLRDCSAQEFEFGALLVAQFDAPIPRLIGLSHRPVFAVRRPAPARRAPACSSVRPSGGTRRRTRNRSAQGEGPNGLHISHTSGGRPATRPLERVAFLTVVAGRYCRLTAGANLRGRPRRHFSPLLSGAVWLPASATASQSITIGRRPRHPECNQPGAHRARWPAQRAGGLLRARVARPSAPAMQTRFASSGRGFCPPLAATSQDVRARQGL